MSKVYSGSPVSRSVVFILADGAFVVQWDESRVQELLSGRYRPYTQTDFGHAITDFELNQLKAAGLIEHYNRQYVWLYALPEAGRYQHDGKGSQSPSRVRSYYLNTTLPKNQLAEVQSTLAAIGAEEDFLARARGDLVAVLGKNGAPFRNLQDAELAQKHLAAKAPAIFQYTAIAFVETAHSTNAYRMQSEHNVETLDLSAIITSQTDISVSTDKRVVLVVGDADERNAIRDLLLEMQMKVWEADKALDGLQLLEDCNPHLLIMGMELPDMHGWQLLAKIKEIEHLRELPKIIIAEHTALPDTKAFALTVVKVDVYLMKPVSMAQLRQYIWTTLRDNEATD